MSKLGFGFEGVGFVGLGFAGVVGFLGSVSLVSGFFSLLIPCFSSATAISLSTVFLVRYHEIGKSFSLWNFLIHPIV
ncbi:hypothetical protein IKN40_03090 [bacterium]|nr:hypothetical protein [bacterium]